MLSPHTRNTALGRSDRIFKWRTDGGEQEVSYTVSQPTKCLPTTDVEILYHGCVDDKDEKSKLLG